MTTSSYDQQLGKLTGQLVFLVYRLVRAEFTINALKENVTQDQFALACNRALGNSADLSDMSLNKYIAIFEEIGSDLDIAAVREGLLKIKSEGH